MNLFPSLFSLLSVWSTMCALSYTIPLISIPIKMNRTNDTLVKLGIIGEGSYAKVYKVLKKLNNTEYALKVVDGTFLKR